MQNVSKCSIDLIYILHFESIHTLQQYWSKKYYAFMNFSTINCSWPLEDFGIPFNLVPEARLVTCLQHSTNVKACNIVNSIILLYFRDNWQIQVYDWLFSDFNRFEINRSFWKVLCDLNRKERTNDRYVNTRNTISLHIVQLMS